MLIHIFASNVKKYRMLKAISQEELSELSGLHRTYISSVEMGNRNVSIKSIEKLARALNVTPSKLLEEE